MAAQQNTGYTFFIYYKNDYNIQFCFLIKFFIMLLYQWKMH